MSAPRAVIMGAPGSGKSTVGALLAELLDVEFVDVDAVVEERAGKPIGEIFLDDGEETFRALERATVSEALRASTGVVALGGGAVLHPDTRADLAEQRVVYLHVSFEEAVKRVGLNRARPLLAGNPRARLKALLEERLPIYESLATITVSTSGYHPKEIVEDIVDRLRAGE